MSARIMVSPSSPPRPEDEDRVLASMVQGTIAGFSALGMNADALVRVSGVPPEGLADPDGLVEYEALVRLWAAALEHFPGRPLGMILARQIARASVEPMGVFGYAARNCRDVRQSYELFVRYCPMVFPRLQMRLTVEGAEARLQAEHEPRVVAMVEPIEMFVATMALQLAQLNAKIPGPRETCFAHARRHPLSIYTELLGERVRFSTGWSGFVFDAEALELPITGSNPQIGRYLQQQAEAQLEALGPDEADPPLDAQVRSLIDQQLMAGTGDQASVARALGMSARTLQRGLKALGTSFGRQLEDVRRQRAELLLLRPRLSVAEVAFMLGYHNPRAFYRSFRRWTGQTPSEYRRAGGR